MNLFGFGERIKLLPWPLQCKSSHSQHTKEEWLSSSNTLFVGSNFEFMSFSCVVEVFF